MISQDERHAAYERLMASDLETWRMVRIVFQCYTSGNGYPMWQDVSTSYVGAETYYASLDEDERRSEAALVLAAYGWTRSRIWRVFS